MNQTPVTPLHATSRSSVDELETRCINTIRMLAVDAVQQANSGHPGMPMGAGSWAQDTGSSRTSFDTPRRFGR
jgi:hypothetical protein